MIYIVASNFYKELSNDLIEGATASLTSSKIASSFGIKVIEVPGAFEIPGMVKKILDNKEPSLIITLGVIVKGETNHFEQISEFVFDSISKLTMSSDVPISFGVISALNYNQAEERALISKKNKGAEVASAGLKMLELYDQYKK
tara:strand:- start:8 stop:439 length:432 start_codon:yes stop_codon:yes gene_type:complete